MKNNSSLLNKLQKHYIILNIVLLTVFSSSLFAGLPKCYGVTDSGTDMFFMVPNPGANPLPTFQTIDIGHRYMAEGAAYRPSNQKMYLFDCAGDNHGPCALYETTIDIANGTSTRVLLKSNILASSTHSIEGATFIVDDVNGVEFLFATAGEGNSFLYKWETTDWNVSQGYPVAVTGATTEITGIAYNPTNDRYYGMNDSTSSDGARTNADVYEINLATGVTTFVIETFLRTDSEGITYAADGLLYTEDESLAGLGRGIWTLNLTDGSMIKAASFAGTSGDVESLACNAGEKTDMGDLPDIYGYSAHTLPVFSMTLNTMYLGINPGDNDFGTQNNSANAQGDDADDANDDDDGVNLNGNPISDQILEKSAQYTLDVRTNAQSGFLSAWVDWNNDGDFDDPGETIVQDVIGSSTITTMTLNVPTNIANGAVYMRVRYSSDSGLASRDDVFMGVWASDGETEDYRFYVDDPALIVNKVSTTTHTPVELGDIIDYNITVKNPSNIIALNNLVILDTLPIGTTYNGNAQMTYWVFTNETFSDTITANASYNDNDGTQNWGGPWVELGDDGVATTGDIRKVIDSDLATNEVISIVNADNEIKRSANLVAYVAATLTLDYRRKNNSNVDTQFFIDVSSNGAPWTQLAAIQIVATDANYISLSYDISSHISSNTTVRFRTGATADAADIMYLDNIKITAFTKTLTTINIAGPDVLVAADANITLLAGDDLNITYSVTVMNPVPSGQKDINNTVSVTSNEITDPQTSTVSDPLLKARLLGHVYYDVNGNGDQDVGEPNIVGTLVTVRDANGVEHNVTTDGTGHYRVSDVNIGNVTVTINIAGHYQSEGTNGNTVNVVSGDNLEESNGFAVPAQLTGHLYNDANANGVQEATEANLSNISVRVTASRDVNRTVTTDANGNYSFPDLPLWGATVTIDTSGDLNGHIQTEGTNPTKLILVSGANTEENNGFFQSGTLTGHVYSDVNGNGNQDAGESNLSGITVTVTDSNGVDHVVTTDANGNYMVTGLSLGAAIVTIDTGTTSILNAATQTEGTNPSTVTDLSSLNIVAGPNTEENNGFTLPLNLFTKTSTPQNALLQVGDTIDYNITFANNSAIDLTNVNLADILPEGTVFVSGAITYSTVGFQTYTIADYMTRNHCIGVDAIDSYTCVDGNATAANGRWVGMWDEHDENSDNDNNGDIRMIRDAGDQNGFSHGTNDGALRINIDTPGEGIQRTVNLSQYVEANLSFMLRLDDRSTNNDSPLILEISSDNGSNYTTLETFVVTVDVPYELKTYNITSHISAQTIIRFRVGAEPTNRDRAYIDDLIINVKKETITTVTTTLASMEALDDSTYTVYAGRDLNASFQVTVANPLASHILDIKNTATLTIDGTFDSNASVIDPVASNVITLTSDTKMEGNNLVHIVTMDRNLSVAQTYAFSIENNTTENEDYGMPTFSDGVIYDGNGTITVPAGVRTFRITNLAIDDPEYESGTADEFYDIHAGTVSATGTIQDNDVLNPLPVTISYAYPQLSGSTLDLDFSTSTETGNIGFNIYAIKGKKWTKLNDEFILGALDSLIPIDYKTTLMLPNDMKVNKIGIAGVDVNGVEDRHGPFKIDRESGSKTSIVPIRWEKVRQAHKADRKARKAAKKSARKAKKQAKSAGNQARRGLFRENIVNLKVSANAVYRISHEDLLAKEINLNGMNAKRIAISFKGEGVERHVANLNKRGRWTKKSYLEFKGKKPQGTDALYLKANNYRLSFNRRMVLTSEGIEPITVRELVFETNNKYSWTQPGEDPFYDALFFTRGAGSPGTLTRTLTLPELPQGEMELTVYVSGFSKLTHQLKVALNGAEVASVEKSTYVETPINIIVNAGMLSTGDNTLSITVVGTEDNIAVFTYDKTVLKYDDGVANAALTPEIALSDKLRKKEIRVKRSTNYLIIAHPMFIGEALERYVSHKEGEGWKIQVVDVEDIYDAYGYGMETPQAIQTYLDEAKTKRVTHVQLVGAASYDYKDYLGLGSISFIPSIYVHTGDIVRYTPCDGCFVADNNGLPELAIGRWPVRTSQGLEAMINKTLDWYNSGQSSTHTALMIADQKEEGADFSQQMQSLSQQFENNENWNSVTAVYFDEKLIEAGNDVSKAIEISRTEIIDTLNNGVSLVSFTGHSSPTMWSFKRLLTHEDAVSINNAGSTALALPLACYTNYADSPTVNTMAHQFLAESENGFVAIYGAATLSSFSQNGVSAAKVTEYLLEGETIGEAVLKTKRELGVQYMDIIRNSNLLGDVTLEIK